MIRCHLCQTWIFLPVTSFFSVTDREILSYVILSRYWGILMITDSLKDFVEYAPSLENVAVYQAHKPSKVTDVGVFCFIY
jgi:hypothetical protein